MKTAGRVAAAALCKTAGRNDKEAAKIAVIYFR